MTAWWKILEVERGAELRAIKRAYAAKLKTIRQDENPAGFMELRAAYEQARNAAQYRGQDPAGTENFQTTDNEVQTEPAAIPPAPEEPPAPTVMDDVVALMKTPWGGSGAEAWQAILEDERLEAIDDFTDFEQQIFYFLLDNSGYYEDEDSLPAPKITPAIASQIFAHFNWNKTRGDSRELGWLSKRLAVTNFGTPAPNWFSRGANSPKTIRKKTPKTDKFTHWYDNEGGIKIVIPICVLLYVLLIMFSPGEDKKTDIPDLPNTREIQLGEKLKNISNLECPEDYDFDIPQFKPQGPESLADAYTRRLKTGDTPEPAFPDSDIELEGLELSPELQQLLGERCKPRKDVLDVIIEKSGEKK